MKKLLTFAFFDLSMRIRIILEYPTMKKLLTFAFLLCTISALQAQTLADTTKITVFDRTNQWIATGAQVRTYSLGNAYLAFAGPTTSLKTITFPNANANVLTDNAAVTIAQGGTGQTTANAALNALLPSQTSNSGKVLSTNGTNSAWISAGVGDLVNGGNATGATVSAGTNDANPFTLKYNNTALITLSSTGVTITGNMLANGQYNSANYALTDGATIALSWNNGNVQSVTLGGNRTFTFANPVAGGRYLIVLKQDATGSRTVTWPTVKWRGGTAPTLTTTANKYDLITLIYDGTNYYGDASLNY